MTEASLESVNFLIKTDADTYNLVPKKELIEYSIDKIYRLALINKSELRTILLLDVYLGDHYINNMLVSQELNKTLDFFNEMYPGILNSINLIIKNKYYNC